MNRINPYFNFENKGLNTLGSMTNDQSRGNTMTRLWSKEFYFKGVLGNPRLATAPLLPGCFDASLTHRLFLVMIVWIIGFYIFVYETVTTAASW